MIRPQAVPQRFALTAAAGLYLAAACQQSLGSWRLLGSVPDFMLLSLAGLCMFTGRTGGAVIGFLDGWIYASLIGANMWQYVLTRTLGGYAIAWVAEGGLERSVFSALLAGVFAVFACQLTLLFLAPPSEIGTFLGDTIRTAVYNGVLAMVLYTALNKILGARR